MDKETLRKRIDQRVDEMIAQGGLEECKRLYPNKDINALKTVGSTERFDFIDGKTDWETTITNIKTNTWHYAKRQLTWFKKDKEIKWFEPQEEAAIHLCCQKRLPRYARNDERIKNITSENGISFRLNSNAGNGSLINETAPRAAFKAGELVGILVRLTSKETKYLR